MQTLMPTLAMIALAGFCSQADAQEQCPELSRLRSEAAEALKLKERAGRLVSDNCQAHIRSAMAWGEMVQYANDHRESCDISIQSLSEFEKYHRAAVTARNNVCAGRPVQPFPAEIIRR
jgi:hypothetical protein